MIVADTSPLNYLILIDQVEILHALFREVWIPFAVRDELAAVGASEKVRDWIAKSPQWLKVTQAGKIAKDIKLGKGESESISLAIELSVKIILLDDKSARSVAKKRNLTVIGTIGILKLADKNKLSNFETTITRLQKTNFRVSRRMIEELISRHRQEKFSN